MLKKKNEKRKKKRNIVKNQIFFSISKIVISRIFFFFQISSVEKTRKKIFFELNKWMIDSWNKACSKFQSISWIISRSYSQFKMQILKFLQNKTQNWIVSNEKNTEIYHDQKCDIKIDAIKCNDINQMKWNYSIVMKSVICFVFLIV